MQASILDNFLNKVSDEQNLTNLYPQVVCNLYSHFKHKTMM